MRSSLFLLIFVPLFVYVHSHGLLAWPPGRGIQKSQSIMRLIPKRVDLHDHILYVKKMKVPGMIPQDCPHCLNGGGKGGVMKANKGMWVSYEPTNLKKPFRGDAGLCGDPIAQKAPRAHSIGGPWGFPKSPITVTYKTGSVVEFIVDLTTNHQGYFEYFLCDATKCGGDISEACFKKGHCHQLMREKTPHCEKAQSMECAPVDPAYPGRWYIGCRKGGHVGEDFVGGRSMRYHLPKGFNSKHAVLQWYWVTANSCNPPGFLDYFKNYPMQKWGKCGGDGGTIGGRNPSTAACGGKNLPEEFWNCADIEINESGKPSDGRDEIDADVNEIEAPMDVEKEEETDPKPAMVAEVPVKKPHKHAPEHKMPYATFAKPAVPSSLTKTSKKFPLKHFHVIHHKGVVEPTARHEGGLAFVNGHVYLIGGRGKKAMYSFSPVSKKWKDLGVPPQGEMHHFQAVSLGDTIYIPGAWYGSWPQEKEHNSMYSYNTVTKQWKTLSMPPAGRNRGAAAVGVYGGKIYMAAGSTGGHGATTKLVPYFDVYDPKRPAEGWKPLADIPHTRDHTAGAVVGKYFCVGGGRLGNEKESGLANPVLPIDCYNFETSKWEIKAKLGEGRAGVAVAASCNGLMLIAGGESPGKATTRVDRFNPMTNEFLLPTHMDETRHGFGAATGDCSTGKVYVAAGAGNAGDKPERNTIEVLEAGISKHVPIPRRVHPTHGPAVHRPSHAKEGHVKEHVSVSPHPAHVHHPSHAKKEHSQEHHVPVHPYPMKRHKKVHVHPKTYHPRHHHRHLGKTTKHAAHKPRKIHHHGKPRHSKKINSSRHVKHKQHNMPRKHHQRSHSKHVRKVHHHRRSPMKHRRMHHNKRKARKYGRKNHRRHGRKHRKHRKHRMSKKSRHRRRRRHSSRKSRHRRRNRRGSRKSRHRWGSKKHSHRRRLHGHRRRAHRQRKRKYGWKHGRKCALKWNQCGGIFYKGPTKCCRKRFRCVRINKYYSHCKKSGK